MKKTLLALLLIFPFFISCGSDSDNSEEPDIEQDYTSVEIVNKWGGILNHCTLKINKKDVDGLVFIVVGDIQNGSKKEVIIEDDDIIDFKISITNNFGAYFSTQADYTIKPKRKNTIIIDSNTIFH